MDEVFQFLTEVGEDLNRGVEMAAEIAGVENDINDRFIRNDKAMFEKEILIRTLLFPDESTASMADMSTDFGVKYMEMMTLFTNPGE